MSDFYTLSISITVHTKNTVRLCKQATAQIDRVMVAFPRCKFVNSPLFGETPGKKALYQVSFDLPPSGPLPPRDCKEGVPWRET